MQKIKDAVIAGNRKETEELVLQAISENVDLIQVINEGLAAGLKLIGDRFKEGKAFLPEMMLSAMAAKAGIEIATKDMAASPLNKGTIVIGTVKDDLHDIGKNLVTLVLRASGFKVVDLGVDVSEEEFILGYRSKFRPALIISSGASVIPRELTRGKPQWQTMPTILVVPYYGIKQSEKRAGFKKEFRPISKYPVSKRDLALIMSEEVTYKEVVDFIDSVPKAFECNIELFDIYRGSQVPAGHKSMAFELIFKSEDRTLTDQEVNAVFEDIIARFSSEKGIVLRDG